MASGSITPGFLSGSTNGRGIAVTADSPSGAPTIHTATSTSGKIDYIDLWACNTSGGAVVLTVQFGGVSDPDDIIRDSLAANSGTVRIANNLPLAGGLVVTAYAGTADVITIFGAVKTVEL